MRERAAHAVRDLAEAAGLGARLRVGPEGLELIAREDLIADHVAQLVVVEVGERELRTPFERHDAEARGRELIDHHAATGAGSDHADVELGGCHPAPRVYHPVALP